jgi:hypothetical protein
MTTETVLWNRRLLRAAYWVTRTLGRNGRQAQDARDSWFKLPLTGEVELDELREAERGLAAAALLRLEGDLLVPERKLFEICDLGPPAPVELLLGALLEFSPPLWMRAAAGDGTGLASEFVPDEVESALETVIQDPARRQAFLLARARTVDARERAELGQLGEEALVQACQAQLRKLGAQEAAARVRRLSTISDQLGYDVIAPRRDNTVRRLEAKATRAQGEAVAVHLTRNEFETGCADPDWYLVVIRLDRAGGGSVLGHVSGASLVPLVPEDKHREGRWQVARLVLGTTGLTPGLPAA